MDEEQELPTTREDLKLRLENLPDRIKRKENDMLLYSNNVNIHNQEMKSIEIQTQGEVTAAKDKEGKKEFPNDILRQNETNHRLERNQDYRNSRQNWEHNKKQLQKGEINLKYLQNQFTATKWLVKLITDDQNE